MCRTSEACVEHCAGPRASTRCWTTSSRRTPGHPLHLGHARGNLVERRQDGEVTHFRWNASNQLEESSQLILQQRTRYWYDPLGRRIAKSTEPIVRVPDGAGSRYERNEYVRRMQAEQLGGVLFGWDGDQLDWESDQVRGRTVHYVYEPHSFVPLLRVSSQVKMEESLLQRPENFAQACSDENGQYTFAKDPLYNGDYTPGTDVEGQVIAPLDPLCVSITAITSARPRN